MLSVITYISPDDVYKPHSREKLIELQAGDMVFTHCEILHSGSVNTSTEFRYFISIYLQRFSLPHRDNFEAPAIARIVAQAEKNRDRRTMRLFGQDDLIQERQQQSWYQMIAEERAEQGSSI